MKPAKREKEEGEGREVNKKRMKCPMCNGNLKIVKSHTYESAAPLYEDMSMGALKKGKEPREEFFVLCVECEEYFEYEEGEIELVLFPCPGVGVYYLPIIDRKGNDI